MKKNILITWTSRWLWKFFKKNLENDYNIFWISRTSSKPHIASLYQGKINDQIYKQKEAFKGFNIDLTRFEFFDNLVKILEQKNIIFDTVILNAWVWAFGRFEEIELEKYIEIINLNLLANILLLYKLEKFLNKNTKIIFIWSISSKKFLKYWVVYQASKFGLKWFVGALKNEQKNKKIFFLNPKVLDTDFHHDTKVKLNFKKEQYTKMEDILKVITDILIGKEEKLEIDL
jgi:short-subunit dehydrogenase